VPIRNWLRENLLLLLLVLAGVPGALFLAACVFLTADAPGLEMIKNVSRAMEPSLLVGDRITIVPPSSLRRGTIVTHVWPGDGTKQFIKRIVATGGDTVSMSDGILVLNGLKQSESYAWHEEPGTDPVVEEFGWQCRFSVHSAVSSADCKPSRNTWGPLVVPAGKYFLLGDNRDNSLDSRYEGFVSAEDILGQPRRVYFSRDADSARIRWSRVFKRVQ
jgi:signal peptidase I